MQLTSDGHRPYLTAVDTVFGNDVDYAMLHKIYGASPEERYSPARCLGAEKRKMIGNPKTKHISTSFAERQNLTMRMHMRRFTRLTNAFSKKVENHVAAVELHTMFYNFVRVHQTLKVTPAMAAGVTDRLWDVADLVQVLEDWEALRETEPQFEPEENAIGGGWFVRVTFPRRRASKCPLLSVSTSARAHRAEAYRRSRGLLSGRGMAGRCLARRLGLCRR